MPLLALANAGVRVDALSSDVMSARVTIGAAVGLVLGKPLGIVLASRIVLRLGVAQLPRGLGSRQLLVLGVVAGIGFTMALFIAQLGFADEGLLRAAKLGVLLASGLTAGLSMVLGCWLLPATADAAAAKTADEAECSTEL